MGNSPKTLYLCGVEWLQEKCNHMNFFETFVTKEGEKMSDTQRN
jgi:hypothetical protein